MKVLVAEIRTKTAGDPLLSARAAYYTKPFDEIPAVHAREGEVLVRTLEVGVCGTDREISEGLFGVAPADEQVLVQRPRDR